MSKKTKRWVVLGLFFSLVLSGCQCSDNQIDIMEVILDSPAGEVVSSLLPTFNWHNSESCEPDSYHVYVKENYEYTGGLNYDTPDDTPSYTLTGTPLLPGKEYIWKVEAIEDEYGHSDWSDPSLFYTGPVCSGETLIAPVLQSPQDFAWLMGETEFNWTYNGGCLPDHYHYEFATDPGFVNVISSGPTFEQYAQHVNLTFPNCSSLFWRVAANDGATIGPWSASREFHYILDDTCYQWHYPSEDFAWIKVSVLRDYCDQTGFISAWTATLNPGCMADGMFIVGDGTSADATLHDVVVDLGSGPCPSTGLDQKMAEYMDPFGVITPGTYCVTVSRNQTADLYGPINMMDGIWTNPRVNQILAEETVTFGPGVGDHHFRLFWDEIDRPMLLYPMEVTYACKFGPEDICNTYDFAKEGDTIPLLGRATNSDWKLTQLNGFPCYIRLGNAAINEKFAKYEGFEWRAEDLETFPEPPPCPTPTPEPKTASCSSYNDSEKCKAAGCSWIDGTLAAGYCSN